MKKLIIIALIASIMLLGCNNTKYITVKHIKPVNRHRFYNPKKDKRKKKVKYVRVKILKKSAEVKVPKKKKIKPKSSKVDSTQMAEPIKDPTNEPDSTGTF